MLQTSLLQHPLVNEMKAFAPEIGLILGSGLADLAERITPHQVVPYTELPGFAASTAPGHAGRFILGTIGERKVIAMQGRLHYYEGLSMTDIVQPVRLMHALGIRALIVSNAAGGINLQFQPGDLMVIEDHINFMGTNPLIGPNPQGLTRFPDMTYAYDPDLRTLIDTVAAEEGIVLQHGVYLGTSGPSYETPAEIRAFRLWGADAVGMSTVPEVIVANQLQVPVLAVSCISNMAAGILDQRLTEEEVLETGARVAGNFGRLIECVILQMEVRA